MTGRVDAFPGWRRHAYGEHPAQVAELALPASGQARGIVLLIHGGYWRAQYDRSLQHPVATDLVAGGWAVWNLDYRGVGSGPSGGGVGRTPSVTSRPGSTPWGLRRPSTGWIWPPWSRSAILPEGLWLCGQRDATAYRPTSRGPRRWCAPLP